MREPDFVHLSLPISIVRSTNIPTPNRSSYRSSTIDQRATLIQGTRLGVGVDPAQAHSLRIITSPGAGESMAKRDSRPARYVYRGHSFRPGSPSPRTSPTILCCQRFQLKWCGCPGTRREEFISPCCAIHSLHDCLLGESGVHVGQCQPFCNWVSPSAPCFRAGAPKETAHPQTALTPDWPGTWHI